MRKLDNEGTGRGRRGTTHRPRLKNYLNISRHIPSYSESVLHNFTSNSLTWRRGGERKREKERERMGWREMNEREDEECREWMSLSYIFIFILSSSSSSPLTSSSSSPLHAPITFTFSASASLQLGPLFNLNISSTSFFP